MPRVFPALPIFHVLQLFTFGSYVVKFRLTLSSIQRNYIYLPMVIIANVKFLIIQNKAYMLLRNTSYFNQLRSVGLSKRLIDVIMETENFFSILSFTGQHSLNQRQRSELKSFLGAWKRDFKLKQFVEHLFLKESMSPDEWRSSLWIHDYVFRFRDKFLKQYGEGRLLNEYSFSQDASTLELIQLFIRLSQEAADFYNKEFHNNLRIAVEAFHETYDDKELRFRNYEPFITDQDYLQFGILNFKNEDFVYYDYLVFCLLKRRMDESDDLMLNKESVWIKTQIAIIDAQLKKSACPRPAYHKIMLIFQRINETNYFEYPLTISKSIPDRIKIPSKTISWANVTFENGFYTIHDPSVPSGTPGNLPLRVTDAKSRKEFNFIIALFEKRLPPIEVELENDKLRRILNKPKLSEVIDMLEKYVITNKKKLKDPSYRNRIIDKDFRQEEVSKSSFLSSVQKYKSLFLEYLANAQSDDYKVMCLTEHRVNSNGNTTTEYAFLFTLDTYGDRIKIAMENSLDKRCTYVIFVRKEHRDIAVNEICDFFSSNYENKRSAMASRMIKFKIPDGYVLKRYTHSNYHTWKSNIDIGRKVW